MANEVEGLWHPIVEWLGRHALVTAARIRPPATDATLSAVVSAVGKPLPPDLQQWWRLADGMGRGVLDPLIPLSTHRYLVPARLRSGSSG
jgi:cell wall assembly regulator SMI1